MAWVPVDRNELRFCRSSAPRAAGRGSEPLLTIVEGDSFRGYDPVMSLAEILAGSTGVFHGTGEGAESGPFVSRIEVSLLPNGGVAIDYEATSSAEGVQHREHSLLVAGADGRDRLYVAHSESPFVTEMVAAESGSSRFVQLQPSGPYTMEIVIEAPEPARITYAWWWAPVGEAPVEQSKADARRTTP